MKTCSSSGAGSKKMKMRGFMCQTQLGSVVCMSENPRSSSVIVPSKTSRLMIEHAKLMSKNQSESSSSSSSSSSAAFKYMKLIEPPNLNITTSKQRTTPAIYQVNSWPKVQTRSIASILSTKEESAEDDVFQVVALRVSIHCQGCAGKVKKHLSKMEGVTSFSIDVETKRVTVMGHVSPDWVLESLSKVKKAEFWPV